MHQLFGLALIVLREQVSTDHPAGIANIHQQLTQKHGQHEAEHRMMECLGKAMWEAQRLGRGPDEMAYLECLRQLN